MLESTTEPRTGRSARRLRLRRRTGSTRPPARRIPRRLAVGVGAAAVVVTGGGFVMMSMHSPMAIGTVEVSGAGAELTPAVISALGAQAGDSFSSVDSAAATQQIEAIDGIAQADLGWTWWNTLSVTVQEQTPVGAIAGPNDSFTVIDPSGAVIRTTNARPAGVPLLESSGGPAATDAALVVARGIASSTFGGVDAVVATGAQSVELRMASGTRVVLGTPQDVIEKLQLVQQLSPTNAAVIDLSVPDRPALSGIPKGS